MADNKILVIKNLDKNFGSTQVLKNIDITIDEGDFLVLVGPSGCGKSTLLNCIAGLEEITSGEIIIDNLDMTSVAPKDRNIAMVFQSYALYPTMNVEKNITFGMKVRGESVQAQQAALKNVSDVLQIGDLLKRKPAQLSGGQRQRVAMGRALVRNPRLFLFDEPLSNLDAKLRVEMRAEIKKLHQKLQTSIVYVTHDQTEAMNLATKLAVMKGGVLQQLGAPQEIYDKPNSIFVAGFIGSPAMNLIKGVAFKNQDELFFRTQLNGETIQISIDHYESEQKIVEGQDITLGIRPEYITGMKPVDIEEKMIISVMLNPVLIETNGFDKHVNLEFGDGEIGGRFTPQEQIIYGQPVLTYMDFSNISLFDSQTEKRL
ncbi:MAG: ATP-binding cassette domain-containing protein [OCS116 cluster bacterium]|nr:ATP-binding cassette domain-containing protein [OCS116 cluster bacterium]